MSEKDRATTAEWIALRYYLQGRGFFRALEAMEFAERLHNGTRKDGVTPEFYHQVSMANFARTIEASLASPEEVYVAIHLHDTVEDKNVSLNLIGDRFGMPVTHAVNALSKVIDGVKRSPESVYKMISENETASVVKGIDRVNNQGSMLGVFSLGKQREYIEETETFVLPMLKIARRRFPRQEPAYENIKHILVREIRLFRAMHDEIEKGLAAAAFPETV